MSNASGDDTPNVLQRAAEVLREAIQEAGESMNVPLYRPFATLLALQLEALASPQPRVSASGDDEELKELMSEMRNAHQAYFSWTPTTSPPDWAEEIKPLEERVQTAWTAIESLFGRIREERDRLKADRETIGKVVSQCGTCTIRYGSMALQGKWRISGGALKEGATQ